jgi:hypothetical protein
MDQAREGEQWFCSMKACIGVHADSDQVHTVTTTTGNEADVERVCRPAAR